MSHSLGVADRLISEIPLAVVDLETTGLYPGGDRVVELAVVRVDPGNEPAIALDTLINPRRRVSATEIHGITDEDVADAPTFDQVAGNLTAALKGCVFASYNVYFDAKFVHAELCQAGLRAFPPHLCLMYMRPMLGIGAKCTLSDACRSHRVTHHAAHRAADDAMASAQLWVCYAPVLVKRGIRTFADLAKLRAYKFTKSFNADPLDEDACRRLSVSTRTKSRRSVDSPAGLHRQIDQRGEAVGEYWDALESVLGDLEVTTAEVQYLAQKRQTLGITESELRWLHARAFSGVLADACQDKAVTAEESGRLHRIAVALRELGWAPGDGDFMRQPQLANPTETGATAIGRRQRLFRWLGLG